MRLPIALSLSIPLLLAAPWCLAQTAPLTPEVQRVGTFKQVQGEAWIGVADARRAPTPGDGLRQAERVSTGQTGAATITLKDGTVLTLGPNTTVDLNQFQFDATTQKGHFALDLLQGSIRVVTGLLARINPDLFKVTTPTAVVGVRGTDFIVETSAAQ
ncbi:MAG: hypothetical protein C0443_02825 [Comamonadaceae bacterium]|nr:hypothetical protein [Comamonadaceae bacterium]